MKIKTAWGNKGNRGKEGQRGDGKGGQGGKGRKGGKGKGGKGGQDPRPSPPRYQAWGVEEEAKEEAHKQALWTPKSPETSPGCVVLSKEASQLS